MYNSVVPKYFFIIFLLLAVNTLSFSQNKNSYNSLAGNWALMNSDGPNYRNESAIAFDTERNKLVLFGGISENNIDLGDTWEWDGTEWSLITTSGPKPRHGHCLTYDENIKTVVLFGGANEKQNKLRKTWKWNGKKWEELAVKGPQARKGHSMSYNAKTRKIFLYGGINSSGKYLQDTWFWDGREWLKVGTSGPMNHSNMILGYLPGTSNLLLYGGIDTGNNVNSESWQWDGEKWTPLVNSGTVKNLGHMSIFFQTGGVFLWLGNITQEDLQPSTMMFDGNEYRKVKNQLPFRPGYDAVAYDGKGNKLIAVRSSNVNKACETWVYKLID